MAAPAAAARLAARIVETELNVTFASTRPSHEVLVADGSDNDSSSRKRIGLISAMIVSTRC
jgi:hypothetical protein